LFRGYTQIASAPQRTGDRTAGYEEGKHMSQGANIRNNPNILMAHDYQMDGGGQFANSLVPSPLGVAHCKEISNGNAQCRVDFSPIRGIDFVRVNPQAQKAHRCLPYEENGLTYLTLDANAQLVLSGPINGCHIYVAQNPGGPITVMHVNWNKITTDTDAGITNNRNQKFALANALRLALPGAPPFTNRLFYHPTGLAISYKDYLGFAVCRKAAHGGPWEFYVYGIGGPRGGPPRILRQF
jgi:hypothetical protein